jgi:hypothetical protein
MSEAETDGDMLVRGEIADGNLTGSRCDLLDNILEGKTSLKEIAYGPNGVELGIKKEDDPEMLVMRKTSRSQ